MEIIKKYLDTMFEKLEQSEDVKRAKEELYTMMEDKYNELKLEGKSENEAIGTVIAEFGNLEELADALGIEELINENAEYDDTQFANVAEENKRVVSLEEAKEFISAQIKFGHKIALGVMLCILSPITAVVIDEISFITGDSSLEFIGIMALLVIVAIAVGIFIYNGMMIQKYEWIKKEHIKLNNDCEQYVKEEKECFRPKMAIRIITGVVLCIFSVVPAAVAGEIVGPNSFVENMSAVFLLVVVAIAVCLFITAGVKSSAYSILLQEGDYSAKSKKKDKLVEAIASVYWPVVVCIYLVWSFISFEWSTTWIIWPVAALAFGAIASICNIARGDK